MWRDKYESIARELRAIYYADYLIDKHNDILTDIALSAYGIEDQEECFNILLNRIDKVCRLQIFYSHNCGLLYNYKYKDLIIDYFIKDKEIPKERRSEIRHKIYKFCDYWESRKTGTL